MTMKLQDRLAGMKTGDFDFQRTQWCALEKDTD
jgi:hypothetical protein